MAVRILIKRKVPQGKNAELSKLLRDLRSRTMSQRGYISGETLRRVDHPGENLVISTWESLEDWEKWADSMARNEIQNKIDALLGEKTQYEIYEY